MASKLGIYNGALRLLGERKLASLAENREPRRVLDDLYDTQCNVCLSQANWNFATRPVRLDSDTDIEASFGYTYTFGKPEDWLRTTAVSSDEYFREPLKEYDDVGSYWRADIDPVYVKYVSNDADWGMDLSRWTPLFEVYAMAHFASEMAEHHGPKSKVDDLRLLARRRLMKASAVEAVGQPVEFYPTGSWVRARGGNLGGYRKYNRA